MMQTFNRPESVEAIEMLDLLLNERNITVKTSGITFHTKRLPISPVFFSVFMENIMQQTLHVTHTPTKSCAFRQN